MTLENWEDNVISGGQVLLGLLLIPTLADEQSTVPLLTSIPTSTVLFTFAIAFYSKGMKRPAYTALMTATLWLLVAVLRHP